MGQIFYACVYDTENRICSVVNVDKFHANCYSYSGAVAGVHYLLRQKAYHAMWGGQYVSSDDFLAEELSEDTLLGISTYMSSRNIENNSESSQYDDENYRNNVALVIKNTALWQRINVWDEAIAFFDYEHTESVRYEGFLVNHTKKQAVDLGDYYQKSLSMTEDGELYAIDLIPALTETGGGLCMALFDGMTSATNEKLSGEWCGDLLQIVNDLPDGYECIDCCFADVWSRARFCHREYGVDEEGFLLEQQGKRFVWYKLNFLGKRGIDSFVKVKLSDNTVDYCSVPVAQVER
jgi:hypothetical protein